MRALAYIILFVIPFIYLLNTLTTTAKSPITKPKATQQSNLTPASQLKKPSPLIQNISNNERIITLHNKITDEMLTYYKAGANHPKEFTVSVNNQKIERGKKHEVKVANNILRIQYDYKFHRSFVTRKGAKLVEFELPNDHKEFDITFSWDNEWHIILAHATPKSMTKIY